MCDHLSLNQMADELIALSRAPRRTDGLWNSWYSACCKIMSHIELIADLAFSFNGPSALLGSRWCCLACIEFLLTSFWRDLAVVDPLADTAKQLVFWYLGKMLYKRIFRPSSRHIYSWTRIALESTHWSSLCLDISGNIQGRSALTGRADKPKLNAHCGEVRQQLWLFSWRNPANNRLVRHSRMSHCERWRKQESLLYERDLEVVRGSASARARVFQWLTSRALSIINGWRTIWMPW